MLTEKVRLKFSHANLGHLIRLILMRVSLFHLNQVRTELCWMTDNNDPGLIELDAMERMEKTITSIRGNVNTVRTGRANPAILDRIEVSYYGSMTL